MERIDEIHIVPLGHERDRILGPVREHDVDVVYLLRSQTEWRTLADYQEALIDDLEESGTEVRKHDTELQDLYDVIADVTTLTAKHVSRKDQVRVNVSTGTKIAAIGCAIGCMATGADPYYVHPAEYEVPLEEKPLTRGYEDAEVLPSYPIEPVSYDQVAVLDFLEDTNTEQYTVKKKDLIRFAEDEDLSFMADADPDNEKSKFGRLNSNVVKPLLADGYIQVSEVGRTRQIELTETGENMLHAFKHKLRQEPE